MAKRSATGDETERSIQGRLSFRSLTDGSPTVNQCPDVHEAIPELEFRTSKNLSILLEENHMSDIEEACNHFNMFAQYVDTNAASRNPRESANNVQDALVDIEQILDQASKRIEEKVAQLWDNVEQFSQTVQTHADATWYRRMEDITILDAEELFVTLSQMPFVDVGDFAQYLRESLPAAAKKQRPQNETYGMSFASKVFHHLLRDWVELMEQPREDHFTMMKLYTTVRAKVFIPGRPRDSVHNFVRMSKLIDDVLIEILSKHSTQPGSDDYWNFAASWRELVDGWEEAVSPDKAHTGAFLKILGNFRAKAHWEVRRGVDIAIDGRLPNELADVVFEAAMLAEEIPLQD